MKLNKYTIGVFCSAFAITLASCDDFLTQKNPNEMTTDIFWSNLSDCNKGLTAVYNSFKSQSNFAVVSESNRSDLTWPGVWPKYPQTTNVFYLHTFNDAEQDIVNKWSQLYTGIFRANQVIEGLNKIKETCTSPEDQRKWELIMGQARFFRGLFHFYLNLSYNNGNVPFMDFVPKSESDFFQSCTPSDKVKELYRADLQYAESVLPVVGAPDEWSGKNGDLGRVTSGAASAVLGTSYLYDQMYDEAKAYFQKIINNSSYKLAGPGDNFTTKNEMNSESILEIIYTHDYNTEYDVYSQQILSNILNMQFAPGTCGGWGPTAFPSWWLTRDYTYEPVDKRNPQNKVYLNTDVHGDILYRNKLNKVETKVNGKLYNSYVVLNPDSIEKNGTMVYYTKKIEVDASGNPVITDRNSLPKNTYVKLVSGVGEVKPFKAQPKDGTWNLYKEEDGRYYRYLNHSPRASYSIIMPTEEDMNYYGQEITMDAWAYSNAYGAYRKYTNWDTRTSEKDSPKNMDSDINFRVIRLADVYLMYAECLIKGGTDESGVPEALKYINKVRERAGTILIGSENVQGAEFKGVRTYQDTPDLETNVVDKSFYHRSEDPEIIETAQQVMKHLMYKERPLELSLEGYAIRFMDLRRWGIVKQRFQELSQVPFTTWGIPYVSLKGAEMNKAKVMWGWAFDYDQENIDASPNVSGPQYQYQQAAINYNDDKAYFPIPNEEAISNPAIVKVLN
ncbi:RagB/SusD family nutrient uptake outer membrane protein [Bacteroides xylanisolvens]|jgi:hypothetical protein|uniref:RagB/SusD family nutrient uptake outer membrane protein n=1 Tax=Bacteroides xylanisolvens TaxID=371601 RepID=UPI003516ED42